MGKLDGKVAVITGGSRGLGLAIAQSYAREGAAVVLGARSEEAVQQAVADLQQEGKRVLGLVTDVSDLAQVQALADHALQSFGQLDIWVNNAGVAGVYGPTAALDPTGFEQVMRTIMFGTYYGSLVALHAFLAQQRAGKLINLLGRGDKQPVPFQNAYASSKAWVRHFTLALAKEYETEKGIGIYAFNPGLVDTNLLRNVQSVQGYEERLKLLPMIIRMWGNQPAIPAERALWLASSATDGKTGLEISVLGPGRVARGAIREFARKTFRRPTPASELNITLLAPSPVLHGEEGTDVAHAKESKPSPVPNN
ncbi:MAG: SDR family oxidoreductase [Ktedonobacteraceae bacterium]